MPNELRGREGKGSFVNSFVHVSYACHIHLKLESPRPVRDIRCERIKAHQTLG